jgi:hypothetical protein
MPTLANVTAGGFGVWSSTWRIEQPGEAMAKSDQ